MKQARQNKRQPSSSVNSLD